MTGRCSTPPSTAAATSTRTGYERRPQLPRAWPPTDLLTKPSNERRSPRGTALAWRGHRQARLATAPLRRLARRPSWPWKGPEVLLVQGKHAPDGRRVPPAGTPVAGEVPSRWRNRYRARARDTRGPSTRKADASRPPCPVTIRV